MAHELTTRAGGKVEMAYIGDTPWHSLGQLMRAGATIEEWTVAAGMDWLVRKAKLHYYADRKQEDLRQDDDYVALIRSDNGERLGIVSADYQIVQPYEILEFFRDLVADAGFTIETAGTLFGGKRFWALAKLDSATIAGWDKIGGYYLLSTTADGTRATDGRETTVRVVCNNTLSMAMGFEGSKHGFKMSHRQRFDHKKIHAQLGLARDHFAQFTEMANILSTRKIKMSDAEEFLLGIMRPDSEAAQVVAAASPDDSFEALLKKPFAPSELEADPEVKTRRPRGLDEILALFDGEGRGASQVGSAGTAWGLVNSVTEYVDHYATAKTLDHRLDRAFWGSGDELKTEVLQQAVTQFV